MKNMAEYVRKNYPAEGERMLEYAPQHPIEYEKIHCVMISEVVANSPNEDFYAQNPHSPYLQNALALFEKAGLLVKTMEEVNQRGIYITNAVKMPKSETTITKETVEKYVPLLKEELSLFPNLRVIMLMGDVARKAFNIIAKKETKKNALPSGSTYKIRKDEWFYKDIRLLPAYIMTGKNLLIEKSKVEMSVEEMQKMLAIIE